MYILHDHYRRRMQCMYNRVWSLNVNDMLRTFLCESQCRINVAEVLLAGLRCWKFH